MEGEGKDRLLHDGMDPLAKRIVDMAVRLGIDPSSEFHLLPIAKHAVDSPEDWNSSLEEG